MLVFGEVCASNKWMISSWFWDHQSCRKQFTGLIDSQDMKSADLQYDFLFFSFFCFNFVSKLLVFLYSLDLLQTYWGRIWWLQDCLVMYEKQRLQIYFLKVSQIWQENNCVGILLWWSYSPAKFAKFLRELFLQNILLGIVSNISF